MKAKITLGTLLTGIIIIGLMAPLARANTLVKTDFEKESFARARA